MRLSNTMMINASLLPSSKKAFTLAEVLITLSILGVVAALTIPSLVNRQSDLAAQVKLKKAIANYENMAAVYMVENDSTDIKGLLLSDAATPAFTCTKLSNYFKVVNGPTADGTTGCSFTTSDGAAWYINTDGFVTVADSTNSPRYAVSMWTINGQVNGQGETDGTQNAPTTSTYLKTLYKNSTGSISLNSTTNASRYLAPVTEFMNGNYTCTNSDNITVSASPEYKVTCSNTASS